MQRLLDCIEALALLAVAALCIAVAVAAWRVGELAQTVNRTLPATLSEFGAALSSVQQDTESAAASLAVASAGVQASTNQITAATRQVQTELAPIAGQANADLQEAHRLILESGLTAMEARKASAEERAALPEMTAKADTSLDALSDELGALHETTIEMDRLIGDPANLQTLQNLSSASGSLASTAQDSALWVHSLLHPSWPHRVYHVGLDVAHALLDPF